jgi:ATP-dependent Lhr-like helicase
MILPARVRNFRAEQLDELGAMGWLVWTGHSPLRADDGRIMLFRRERVDRLLIPVDQDDAARDIENFDDRHRGILERLSQRGASFHAELLAAMPGVSPTAVLDALWDLVWAGLVTNDTFAALRSLSGRRRAARDARAAAQPRSESTQDAQEPSAMRRRLPRGWWRAQQSRGARNDTGPGGRWSLVRDLIHQEITSTERAHAWAATLLERHAIVARETGAVEALGGGFGSVYGVLRSLEDAGRLRRGYFVEGLGGMQFAYPGIVDRLRRERDAARDGTAVALAATDPANPYGWLLPWPALTAEGEGNPPVARRAAGSVVALVDGLPVMYLDRNGRRLRTFVAVDDTQLARALSALRGVARARPARTLTIEHVGSVPAIRSSLAPLMKEAGFQMDYRYMRLRAQ